MKKALLIIAGILTLLVALGAAAYYSLNQQAVKARQESLAFVKKELPQVVANWDPQALLRITSPQLKPKLSAGELEKVFTFFTQKLGPLKQYGETRGQSNVTLSLKGFSSSAVYISQATFAKGPAQLLIGLRKQQGQWHVTDFRVDSPAFREMARFEQEKAVITPDNP